MDAVCRLCCSASFVNNDIFDEEGALYEKMSLYLPIEVFRGDRLPQKICDRCSCRVNDIYQFCSEAIEVQNRLRLALKKLDYPTDEMVDLTIKRESVHSPESSVKQDIVAYQDRATQTDTESTAVELPVTIKEEPKPPITIIKEETDTIVDDDITFDNFISDDSDVSLNTLKKKKNKTKRVKNNGIDVNGDVKENKKSRKRRRKVNDLDGMCGLPESTSLTALLDNAEGADNINTQVKLDLVKTEEDDDDDDIKLFNYPRLDNSTGEWRCCICFIRMCLRSEMLQHYRSHAVDTDKDPDLRLVSPPITEAGYFKCAHCNKEFSERVSWGRHMCKHQRRPFRCGLCEKTFKEASQILKHGQRHTSEDPSQPASKRFVCDFCPKEFVYMRSLMEHRILTHPEAAGRKFVNRCVQCGREFAHVNSLRRHLRSHSGERNHLCNVCGKALSSREHLKFHIRIHTGYKPNVCKTCGKGFVKKCNLTLHERVHSGEKPHVCSHCGKAFSQRSTLVIHERYHSGARPYVCSLCGRGFVAKGLLSMHLKTTCI